MECLYAHNYLRSLHGVPPLVYDAQLGNETQEWAELLSKLGHLITEDNGGDTNDEFQQNSYIFEGINDDIDIQEAVLYWYVIRL